MENENNNIVTENQEVENQENTETKTYTQEEVMALIQREADKRVSDALKTQQKKYDKQLKLSSLDGVEREKAEKDQRIADLEEQIKNFNILTQKNEVMKTLNGRNLSSQFSDYLNITDDVENNQKIIEGFDRLFKDAVKTEVEKKLSGNVPKENTNKPTKDSFKNMSLAEKQNLFNTNKDLYNQLAN